MRYRFELEIPSNNKNQLLVKKEKDLYYFQFRNIFDIDIDGEKMKLFHHILYLEIKIIDYFRLEYSLI